MPLQLQYIYRPNKNCAQNKKHLFCMLYFVDVFYNMKCLRNTYFLYVVFC